MIGPRILVCGNRDWTCKRTIMKWMHFAHAAMGKPSPHMPTLIHGRAKGADLIAAEFAGLWRWNELPYPANWDKHGKAAGPIRNREMADANPDIGLAFGKLYRGSKLTGTGDMVSVLNARGIPVIVIGEPIQ